MPEGREAAEPRDPLDALLAELVTSGEASAAVALVGVGERQVACSAAGWASEETGERAAVEATPATRFDLASLTKPVVATLALALARRGRLPLDLAVGEVFPAAHPRLRRQRLATLLRHRAGFVPWTPLYARAGSREEACELLLGGELLAGPEEGARRARYSDLGYVLWGFAAEQALGTPLGALLDEHLCGPLALRDLGPLPGARPDVATCRLGNEREVELARAQGIVVAPVSTCRHGVPQDGNVRFLGGLAGHSGLFGTAGALWKLAREWMDPQLVLSPAETALALRGSGRFLLGWWRRRVRGSAGPVLSPRAFGMIGFTGGSCWLDPQRELVAVLLTHRHRASFDLAPWRRRFHRLAVEAAASSRPASAADRPAG